ncbi:hypothetical protein KVE99_03480 [Helicobacter pylori]|nr:hypothetical protein KVE99_03480 [Helicobacter pylori]
MTNIVLDKRLSVLNNQFKSSLWLSLIGFDGLSAYKMRWASLIYFFCNIFIAFYFAAIVFFYFKSEQSRGVNQLNFIIYVIDFNFIARFFVVYLHAILSSRSIQAAAMDVFPQEKPPTKATLSF